MRHTKLHYFNVFLLASLVSFSASLWGDGLTPVKKYQVEKAVYDLLDDYMAAFNKLDIDSWEQTFHFPHYRLASGEMSVLQGPSGRTSEQVREALGQQWHHSGWDRRKIVHMSPNKVHVDTRFSRYREDGSIIASYDSLYVLTLENGRWGVKLRSSMAP